MESGGLGGQDNNPSRKTKQKVNVHPRTLGILILHVNTVSSALQSVFKRT